MSWALGLLADPILALDHGLLDGPEMQGKPKLVGNAAQLLFMFGNVRLPIAVPHQPGLGIHAGNPWTGSIEPFLAVKTLPADIAQRDVCHPQVVHKPGMAAIGARNTLPEKRQLKAKPVAVCRLHIPRVVPPLSLKVLMVEVV